jgi:hypothetical protein
MFPSKVPDTPNDGGICEIIIPAVSCALNGLLTSETIEVVHTSRQARFNLYWERSVRVILDLRKFIERLLEISQNTYLGLFLISG